MSIASEILRIEAARNKARAQAVALGLKTWGDAITRNMISYNASGDSCTTGKTVGEGVNCKLELKFNDVNTRNIIKNDSFTCIKIVDTAENYDEPFFSYDNGEFGTKNMVSAYTNEIDADTLTYFFETTSSIYGLTVYLYQEMVDDMPVTISLYTGAALTSIDNLDSVADAFASMAVKSGETISANSALSDGYYKGCSVLPEQFGTVVLYDNDTPTWHVTDWSNGDISYVFTKGMTWAEAFQEDLSVSRYSDYALGEKILANGDGYVYEDYNMKFLLTPDGRYVHKNDAVCYHRYDLTSTAPNA